MFPFSSDGRMKPREAFEAASCKIQSFGAFKLTGAHSDISWLAQVIATQYINAIYKIYKTDAKAL